MVKQTPKMTALVVSAIRNLREVQGSTPREIMNYIQAEYNASNPTSESAIQRKLVTALKRGLEYGILKRVHGHYTLNGDPETVAPTNETLIGPMERSCGRKVRRRHARKGGCRRGRSMRKRRRGGCGRRRRRRRRGRSRGGKSRCKSRRRRRRHRSRGGKKCCGKKRSGRRGSRRRSRRRKCGSRRGDDDMDMLAKDPVETTSGRHRENVGGAYAYEREDRRSQSQGRQSAGSRSRSPTHSRSSGSSDREGNERNRRDRQVE